MLMVCACFGDRTTGAEPKDVVFVIVKAGIFLPR